MSILMESAEYHVTSDIAAKGIAEGVCDMINLFTVKELEELQKKNSDKFNLIHGLFHAISKSKSRTSMIFKEVCNEKLGKAKNELMNSGNPKLDSRLIQDGGSRGVLFLIFAGFWVLMCTDLLANPGTAITLSVILKFLQSISGLDRLNNFLQGIFSAVKEEEYPVAYALGRGVVPLLENEGAHGKAYLTLKRKHEEVKVALENSDELGAGERVESLSLMTNLVECAKAGTCSSASDTMIGLGLAPLAAADEARPKLSVNQVEQDAKLKSLEKKLATEQRKWFKNNAKIAEITQNITKVLTEINATNTLEGVVRTVPSLSDGAAVTRTLSAVGNSVMGELSVNGSSTKPLVLNHKGDSSVLVLSAPKVITSEALVAVGVSNFTVKFANIARRHRGSEVDMAAVNAIGRAYDIKVLAQQTVGGSLKVDVHKVKKLVNDLFKGSEKGEGMMEIFGVERGPEESEGKDLLTALVLEAAANQAYGNAKRRETIVNVEIAKVLDRNIQETIQETITKVTDIVMNTGFNGTRAEAEEAVKEAVDISRMFGVKPDVNKPDYARAVVLCFGKGPCPKKPFSELRDRVELLDEMKSWGLDKRFRHASWNMILSGVLMLGTGAIAEVLLTTLVSIIGVGGCLGRCLTQGDKERVQDEEIRLEAARRRAQRTLELENARHARELNEIRNPRAPVVVPGPAGVGLIANAAAPVPAVPAGVGLLANAAAPVPVPGAAAAANVGVAGLRARFEQAQRNLSDAENASRAARERRNRNGIIEARARRRRMENAYNVARRAYVNAGGIMPAEENQGGGTRRRRR